jgi:hypothetical protein
MIIKHIENHHLVWFGPGNEWVLFEEPAWFVYRQSEKGLSPEEVVSKCIRRYGVEEEVSRQFVKEILEKIETCKASPQSVNTQEAMKGEAFVLSTAFSSRSYLLNGKPISIAFETDWLEGNVHPLIAHLETNEPAITQTLFELFLRDGKFGVRVTRSGAVRTWLFDQADLQKGRLFIEILNTLYDRQEDDWMTIVHGSAVTNGVDTLLFSSACGGGKSTMATLLQAHGLKVVSDDMVPVEAKSGKVFPFPAALSVKAGAIDMLLPYYPELANAPVFDFPSLNKQVRYLPLNQQFNDKKLINKVKALIFVNYQESAEFKLERLPVLEAIKWFNQEAWVSSTPENARKYINWISKLPSYRLTYSEGVQAIDSILELFNS